MNIEQIRQLAQLMNQEGLGVIDLTQGEFHIRLEAPKPAPDARAQVPSALAAPLAPDIAQVAETNVDFNNARSVKAPMVGVFYHAAAPEEDPFVAVGSKVKKGDTLCIIEAMKLMNEIAAPCDGEIVDICVANGDVVEYGQILFRIC